MDVLDLAREEAMPEREPTEETFIAFAGWTPEEIDELRHLGRLQVFQAGETVIEAGASADRDLYIIVSGELDVLRAGGPVEQRIARLGPRDVFGEMSFVDGRPRSAHVRALTPSRALRIRPEDLDALCARNPGLALRLMREIACILSFRLRRALA
jgi:CRP-like cAMP-binding protein